jgi:tetratricopeptide (TPR) repeat protein
MGITLESTILTAMNKIKTFFLTLLVVLISVLAMSQPVSYKKEFDAAKANLDAGNFKIALSGFAKLLESDPAHPNSAYSSFFYGVSAYSLGQKEKAKDMFLQITRKYSTWDKSAEAYLWLIKTSFEMSSPNMGMFYTDQVEDDAMQKIAVDLRNSYLSQLDIPTLQLLLEENENEDFIAQLIATKIISLSYDQRDNEYLYSIIGQYNLDSTGLGLTVPGDMYKEQYKVAVMLPLYVDRLWESGVYIQKSLAVDLYEGMKLAISEFDSTKIKLQVFDTKKDSAVTQNILESGQLKGFDAIIGPLYPKPLALVSTYSNENKINFVNPVSTNSELVKHNPYGFLLRTGAESIGKIVAQYAEENIENKACAIYYGPRGTDSLTAYNYSVILREDSFHVAIAQKTQTDKAREIYDSLTSSVPVVDSVELERMWREGLRVRVYPKKDSFLLKIDSLGHIFIASDNQAIASEVMSAITSRGDTTQLIGVGNWFSTANASLGLMESLGVLLAMQEYENMLNPTNIRIRNMYSSLYNKKPSKYVYYGYYAMKFLGLSLMEYGVYFQNGYKTNGNIDALFDFAGSQDNQKLVLYKLEAGIPVIINPHNLD